MKSTTRRAVALAGCAMLLVSGFPAGASWGQVSRRGA
jgi:hypothetical protein